MSKIAEIEKPDKKNPFARSTDTQPPQKSSTSTIEKQPVKVEKEKQDEKPSAKDQKKSENPFKSIFAGTSLDKKSKKKNKSAKKVQKNNPYKSENEEDLSK